MAAWSLGIVSSGALALWWISPLGAISLLAGGICGCLNAVLSMRGNERLVDHKSVSAFVFGSILRIVVFAIVPVAFAARGPWWTLPAYFLGFFTPLALYTMMVARDIRTEHR